MKIKNFKNLFVAFVLSQLFFFTTGCGESVKPADEPNNTLYILFFMMISDHNKIVFLCINAFEY